MDHTLTLRWTMPSSVPFAVRPFPNSNGVIFRRIHSIPMIRALGSESSCQGRIKKRPRFPMGLYNMVQIGSLIEYNFSSYISKESLVCDPDSKAEASKSRGNRLPRSFQEKLDERAARGDFGYHHLLGIDVPDKFKFKKEDKGKEQEAIPIKDGLIIEDDFEEADVDFFEPPSGGIPYDGKSTKPEDIAEWVRTRLSFGDKI